MFAWYCGAELPSLQSDSLGADPPANPSANQDEAESVADQSEESEAELIKRDVIKVHLFLTNGFYYLFYF